MILAIGEGMRAGCGEPTRQVTAAAGRGSGAKSEDNALPLAHAGQWLKYD